MKINLLILNIFLIASCSNDNVKEISSTIDNKSVEKNGNDNRLSGVWKIEKVEFEDKSNGLLDKYCEENNMDKEIILDTMLVKFERVKFQFFVNGDLLIFDSPNGEGKVKGSYSITKNQENFKLLINGSEVFAGKPYYLTFLSDSKVVMETSEWDGKLLLIFTMKR